MSNTLQAEKISACEGKRNTLLVLSVVQSMRNKDLFNDFYDVHVENAKVHNSIKDPVIKRKRNVPKYSLLHFLEGHNSNELASHPATACYP